jgi:tripartite-type tricarboxylate transporter receptor subunit TctC
MMPQSAGLRGEALVGRNLFSRAVANCFAPPIWMHRAYNRVKCGFVLQTPQAAHLFANWREHFFWEATVMNCDRKGAAGMWTRILLAALALAGTGQTLAQPAAYPLRPVRIIVAFPPGGGVDVIARVVAQRMPGIWGQQLVVDNRPGAAGVLATRTTASAPADGYTVLMHSTSMVIAQLANANAGYDIERQLIPVLNAGFQASIIVAAPDRPVTSIADVIALSKTRKLNYGSPGQGSVPHLAAAYLFNLLAKTDIVHVPYAGAAPALAATMGSQIDLACTTLPPAVPLVGAGKLKALATTSAKRSNALPNVPTVAESGYPGYEVNLFSGFFMPAGTPQAVVDRFHETATKVMDIPEVKAQLATLGFDPASRSRDEFKRQVSSELKMWGKVIESTGLKLD